MFYKSWVVLSDQFVIQNFIILVKTKNAYKALKRKLNLKFLWHWHYGSRKNSYFAKLGILSQQGGWVWKNPNFFVKLENKISLCVQHNLRCAFNTILEVLATLF